MRMPTRRWSKILLLIWIVQEARFKIGRKNRKITIAILFTALSHRRCRLRYVFTRTHQEYKSLDQHSIQDSGMKHLTHFNILFNWRVRLQTVLALLMRGELKLFPKECARLTLLIVKQIFGDSQNLKLEPDKCILTINKNEKLVRLRFASLRVLSPSRSTVYLVFFSRSLATSARSICYRVIPTSLLRF